ncbi:MAG: glycerol-3-phosphate 1-O-acyltransferase PlsY [Butyricicoccus sp.]
MSLTIRFVLIAVIGYLFGSFNTAIVVSKIMMGKDIRTMGSGNAGLTNSYRCMGGTGTLLVLAGDILKTVFAVLIAAYIFAAQPGLLPVARLLCGLFVIAGHMFPLYFGFKGGKGVLAGATLGAMFNWKIFVILAIVFVLIVAITRYVSLGSIVIAAAFPFMSLGYYWNSPSRVPVFLMTLIIGGGIIYMHRSNIGRLLKGKENKFSFHRS